MKPTTDKQRKKQNRLKAFILKTAMKAKAAVAQFRASLPSIADETGDVPSVAPMWYTSPIFVPRAHTVQSYSAQNRAAKKRRRSRK